MDLASTIGVAAGTAQVLAYVIYMRQAFAAEVRPNGTSWLMWTYGTLVFAGIEWHLGVPASVLVLPLLCAACSMLVAIWSFATGAALRPQRQDLVILALDLALMLGYVVHVATGVGGETAGPVFAAVAGVNALTAAWPTLRTTFAHPGNERPLAWLVWSAAYGLLALAAMIEGLGWPYLVYPLVNQAVQLVIGLLALDGDSVDDRDTARRGAAVQAGDAALGAVDTP